MRFERSLTIDVKVIFRPDLGTIVDWITAAVEYTSEHVLGDSELHR